MTANIVKIPNPSHEAICIQAIRARKRQESMARIVEGKITHREQEMAA